MTTAINQNAATAAIGDRVDPGLGPKNPTVGEDGRALSHAISRIDVNTPHGKAKKRDKNSQPIPALSNRTRRIVTIGVAFAGICAAALSAPTLFNLARLGHVPVYLAWLLPACLDGYAITSIQFGNSVPADHPAHGAAKRNARHALLLSVGGNFAYHVLVLAGAMLPTWMPIALLVVILSLPPFIVDRLLHLHSLASGSGVPAAVEAESGNRKSSTPASGAVERKQPTEAPASTPASAPASKPLPASAPTGSPDASTRNRPATSAVSVPVASGPIPIQRAARLEVVRGWIDSAGGDKEAVPLKGIQERFGVSQATASRMRAEAADMPPRLAAQPEQAADEEPERVLEAV